MCKICKKIFRMIFPSRQAKRVKPWTKINGDKNLRLDYDLKQDSVVFDLGGYEGQWSSDVYAKYNCQIYVFEPIKEFADNIKKRFAQNHNIRIFNFGLAEANKTVPISLEAESSSIFKAPVGSPAIQLRDVVDFLQEQQLEHIDLMKINIEGGEYDLLDRLISSEFIKKIDNLQIQFHAFVPDAEKRMKKIQSVLAITHHLTYQYEFVWENWEINK